MKLKTALIDCDGVLGDFLTAALAGFSLKPSEVTQWDFLTQLNPAERQECKERLDNPYFWAHAIKPLDSAIGFGDKLNNAGYARITIVTSPWSKRTIPARMDWLNTHFNGQFDAVVFDTRKSDYLGSLFIDDRCENVAEWQQQNPHGKALLFDATYNRDSKLQRLMGWDKLAETLREAA